jgi:glutaredoxin-related protein
VKLLDQVRARAHAALEKVPGRVGDRLRGLNDAIGKPLADAGELADRRAFEDRGAAPLAAVVKPAAAPVELAPVIVYCMDKTKRDANRLTEMLDDAKIPYKVLNITEDPAAQMAVRRDSKGFRLPLVFVAGEVIGGKIELLHALNTGALKKRVFGS